MKKVYGILITDGWEEYSFIHEHEVYLDMGKANAITDIITTSGRYADTARFNLQIIDLEVVQLED